MLKEKIEKENKKDKKEKEQKENKKNHKKYNENENKNDDTKNTAVTMGNAEPGSDGEFEWKEDLLTQPESPKTNVNEPEVQIETAKKSNTKQDQQPQSSINSKETITNESQNTKNAVKKRRKTLPNLRRPLQMKLSIFSIDTR